MFFYSELSGIIPLTLLIDSSSLSFENTCIESSSQNTFTITATGNTTETVLLSDNTDQYSFSPSSFSLSSTGSQIVTVTFAPTSWGVKTGTISITSSGGSTAAVGLSAVCVANPLIITSSVGTIDFGSGYVAESSSATFTVSAGGTVQDIVLMSDDSDQFDFSPTSFSMTGANQTQIVTVYFTPSSSGSKLGVLTLSASGGDVAHVSLTGSGIYRPLVLTASTNTVAFGSLIVNTTSSQTFTVSAGGNAPELVTLSDNSNEFDFSPSSFSLTGSGPSQTVTAKFTPTSTGAKSATLTLSSSGGSTVNVGLAGTALEQYYSSVSLLLNGQTTGSTFLDSSANNFAVSKYGDTTSSSFGPYNKEAGKWGVYMPPQTASNGFGDVLKNSLMVNASSTVSRIGTNFTLEYWFSGSNLSTRNMSICKTTLNSNSSDDWFTAIDTTTGKFSFSIHYAGTSLKTFTSTIPVTASGWHHLAVVKQGTTYRLFIDGNLNYSEIFSASLNVGQANVTIGGSTNNGGTQGDYGRTDCAYSNVRLTNTAVYTASFTPSINPLTAISGTIFLTCQDRFFKDNGPNNYSITVQKGTPMVKENSPFANTVAVTGSSIYFDGTGDYMTVPDDNKFTFDGDFTLESWFYPDSVGTKHNIAGHWPGSVNTNCSWLFQVTTTSKLYFAYGIGSTNAGVLGTSLTLQNYAWNHLAIVRSGSTVKLYLNGVADTTTGTVSGSLNNSTANLSIGYANPSDLGYVKGYIDDLRLTKGIARYTGSFTPPGSL